MYLSFASAFADTVTTYVGFALFTVSGGTGEIKRLSEGKQTGGCGQYESSARDALMVCE